MIVIHPVIIKNIHQYCVTNIIHNIAHVTPITLCTVPSKKVLLNAGAVATNNILAGAKNAKN